LRFRNIEKPFSGRWAAQAQLIRDLGGWFSLD